MRALALLVVMSAGVAAAQTSVDTTVALQQYQEMKVQVLAGQDVDWKAFRIAAAQAGLRKGHEQYKDDQVAFHESVDGDLDKALAAAQAVVDKNMADPEGHFWKGVILDKLNRPIEADREKHISRALLTSIATSGDGKTKETAFYVIDGEEETFFTGVYLGERTQGHDVQQDANGVWSDQQQAVDWFKVVHANWFVRMVGPKQHDSDL